LAKKKFSGSTVPSAAVGKAFADGFYVFADGFERSAKDLFPVVRWFHRLVPKRNTYDGLLLGELLPSYSYIYSVYVNSFNMWIKNQRSSSSVKQTNHWQFF
jgi:hypothetical protein